MKSNLENLYSKHFGNYATLEFWLTFGIKIPLTQRSVCAKFWLRLWWKDQACGYGNIWFWNSRWINDNSTFWNFRTFRIFMEGSTQITLFWKPFGKCDSDKGQPGWKNQSCRCRGKQWSALGYKVKTTFWNIQTFKGPNEWSHHKTFYRFFIFDWEWLIWDPDGGNQSCCYGDSWISRLISSDDLSGIFGLSDF